MSRREKDANQIFDEQCREAKDLMSDLGEIALDALIKQNATMLAGCILFENEGNYDKAEVEWYRVQMNDIDKTIEECKDERNLVMEQMSENMAALLKDPSTEFQGAYSDSIQQLAAKEGLGKTYGQPRRLAQERLRAEMTKCE